MWDGVEGGGILSRALYAFFILFFLFWMFLLHYRLVQKNMYIYKVYLFLSFYILITHDFDSNSFLKFG
jgi:hypothetical protein